LLCSLNHVAQYNKQSWSIGSHTGTAHSWSQNLRYWSRIPDFILQLGLQQTGPMPKRCGYKSLLRRRVSTVHYNNQSGFWHRTITAVTKNTERGTQEPSTHKTTNLLALHTIAIQGLQFSAFLNLVYRCLGQCAGRRVASGTNTCHASPEPIIRSLQR